MVASGLAGFRFVTIVSVAAAIRSVTVFVFAAKGRVNVCVAAAVRLQIEFLGLDMDQMPALAHLLDFHGLMLAQMRAILLFLAKMPDEKIFHSRKLLFFTLKF
ncbi:hypothetical protein Ddc_03703 [Ditylenchus destructor]|nr:hypothetical protein Ddc_03703 [Ditylenchus destructor]